MQGCNVWAMHAVLMQWVQAIVAIELHALSITVHPGRDTGICHSLMMASSIVSSYVPSAPPLSVGTLSWSTAV